MNGPDARIDEDIKNALRVITLLVGFASVHARYAIEDALNKNVISLRPFSD